MRVLVIEERTSVARLIEKELRTISALTDCRIMSPSTPDLPESEFVIYSPPQVAPHLSMPDLKDAEKTFQRFVQSPTAHFILISSAAAYVPQHNNIGLLREKKKLIRSAGNFIANGWQDLEKLAASFLENTPVKLSILRPAAVLSVDGQDFFSRLLKQKFPVVLPGYDPAIQFLDGEDLARAIRLVVEKKTEGVFNAAPDGVINLRSAIRKAGARRLPVSRIVQRITRTLLKPFKKTNPIEQFDFIRYSWTVSNEKSKHELKFAPRYSSAEALRRFKGEEITNRLTEEFDEFGMDKSYIEFFGRTLFKFMHDFYWRVEVDGLEQIPNEGRGVLVGVHRGFMPWDAVMFLHELVTRKNRFPRFLIHPGLIKYPFLFNFHTKLGGVVACRENADYMLENDNLLGIFPEGMRGAFSLYKDAHRIGKFGRNDFVKIALRNRTPIIPFVTVGSAEIFPILAKINWSWWKRQTEWESFPITLTFPFLPPVPLPSKWHTQILPAIHIEEMYEPEAANDPQIVRAISREVRAQMQAALDDLLTRRKSIFYGSIFKEKEMETEPVYKETALLNDGVKLRSKV